MRRLRSVLFAAWFLGLTTLMALAGLVVRAGPTRWTRAYARLWARLVLGGLRWIAGVRWRVEGLEHLPPRGPVLIAPMHQAQFDPLLWTVLRPDFVFVLKQELVRIPLFGGLLRRAGMIPVDRQAGAAAMRGLLRDATAAVADGASLVIFPEGTRRAPGSPLRLQPGIAALAAHTGLPVVPVATDSGLFWRPGLLDKRPGTVEVLVCPPIPPGLRRADLMARLTEALAAASARLATRAGDVDKSVHDAVQNAAAANRSVS